MRVLISDIKEGLEDDYEITKRCIREVISDASFTIHRYSEKEKLIELLKEHDALITTFLPIDESVLKYTPNLKCISVAAVGYSTINIEDAKKYGVKVCHIDEYCTEEVAEHALALMMVLNRNIKYYEYEIENDKVWNYHSIVGGFNMDSKTLAIFGFGKIGKRLAKLVSGFGMKILAVDPYISESEAKKHSAELVSKEVAFREADIISNHMNLTNENKYYFNSESFKNMERKPIFINVGRGGTVCEKDLIEALDKGLISAAGLDVLEDENPDLIDNRLVGRDNVILTPHSAFYSKESMIKLQSLSAYNLAYTLTGQLDRVNKILV